MVLACYTLEPISSVFFTHSSMMLLMPSMALWHFYSLHLHFHILESLSIPVLCQVPLWSCWDQPLFKKQSVSLAYFLKMMWTSFLAVQLGPKILKLQNDIVLWLCLQIEPILIYQRIELSYEVVPHYIKFSCSNVLFQIPGFLSPQWQLFQLRTNF